MRTRVRASSLVLGLLGITLTACADSPTTPETGDASDRRGGGTIDRLRCEPDDAGLSLPSGFCVVIVADSIGAARHMAVTPNGDIFVAINQTRNRVPAFGIVALRDTNADGRADRIVRFNAGRGGSGIAWASDRLWFGENDRIVRYRLPSGSLTPASGPEVVVGGLPADGDHISKTILLRDRHTLFVNIGSASNACQVANRQLESPGVFPCPELPIRAGVWLFDADGTNQPPSAGTRYASGLRNMVALAVNPWNGELYGVQHGRDMLFENWPDFFTVEEDAVLPAEEFVRLGRGSDNGWPYCYHDAVFENRKVLAPEYGGDGRLVRGAQGIDCATYNQPLATFGAHWAPNGLHFYDGRQFPERYRGGAFVAFHGGFDRAPLPNEGYNVMFVPMGRNGRPSAAAEVFADGFAGSAGPLPANARHRPVGVTEYVDGSLLVSDDRGGRIYRIVFGGHRR